ncbi:hypothetical protein GF382_03005 [Candidatus Falkowbacteria bacterium]|nr:hypothetical protein [Candidatus Falkowbacteria bacterium]
MKRSKIILMILFLSLTLSGCSFSEKMGGLKWLDEKAGQFFEESERESALDFIERGDKPSEIKEQDDPDEKTGANDLTQKQKEEIDAWLERKGFNRYGDAKNAVYTGGTPLFNEETGEMIDRYDYILNKYPDILERIKEE